MKVDESEHSHVTTAPISAGSAKRRIACGATIMSRKLSGRVRVMGVSVAAGHIALTRISHDAYSMAALFVSPMTACLLAEYAAPCARPRNPASDAVFTMAPEPCSAMTASSAWRPSHTPRTLTERTRSKSSSVVSATERASPMPALLCAKSRRPEMARVSAITRSQSVGEVTSAATKRAPLPASRATAWPASACPA